MKFTRHVLSGLLVCVAGFAVTDLGCSSGGKGGGRGGSGAGGDNAGSGGDQGGAGNGGNGSGGQGGSQQSGGNASGGASAGSGGGTASGGTSAGGAAGSNSAGGMAGANMGGMAGARMGGAGGTAMGGAGGAAAGNPVFVAVGDPTGRRIRSLDLGKTWVDENDVVGGDSLDNIAWGNGMFIAGTHSPGKIYYSPDGKTWAVSANLNQWVGGVAFGNNIYAGAGGYGSSWFSTDGKAWTNSPTFRDNGEAARSLAFGNGIFTAATDPGNWWTSSDGKTWTKTTGGHTSTVVFCGNAFSNRNACTGPEGHGGSSAFGDNVWVAVVNGGIERSEDGGQTWTKISGAGTMLNAVAFGRVP